MASVGGLNESFIELIHSTHPNLPYIQLNESTQPTHTLSQPCIQSSIHPIIRPSTHPHIYSPTDSFTNPSIHSPIHLPNRSFTNSYIHPPIHPCMKRWVGE